RRRGPSPTPCPTPGSHRRPHTPPVSSTARCPSPSTAPGAVGPPSALTPGVTRARTRTASVLRRGVGWFGRYLRLGLRTARIGLLARADRRLGSRLLRRMLPLGLTRWRGPAAFLGQPEADQRFRSRR